MSERAIVLLLIAGAALAAPVEAQDLAQLRRREAELIARRDELHAKLVREVRDRFEMQPRTVVTVGRVYVAFPQWASTGKNEDLTAALGAHLARYGVAVDSFLSDTIVIGVVEDTVEGIPTAATMRYRVGPEDGSQEVAIDPSRPDEWVAGVVGTALQHWADGLIDWPLKHWLGRLDQRATVAALRDPIVRDLVRSRSSRAQRCLNGAADECLLLLELGEGEIPLLAAYDPADLPGLFGHMDLNDRIPGKTNCVGKRSPEACMELVRLGRAVPPHPVSTRARQSLFAYAVAAGGEGAWLRLHRAA
ncbi:MAG TPA: hypothetical protein VG712_00815, partial [Gemmatimonadales bacterium]|nr:hypothetical protein [Gemmatimonadales bacterium]